MELPPECFVSYPPHIGGKVPELTRTHRNSPGTTPGTHPGIHPGTHPGRSLVYDFVVGACVAGAALIGSLIRSLQTPNFWRLPRWGGSAAEFVKVRVSTAVTTFRSP